jgi:Icc-related predicted phosphoesterase
MKLACEGKIRLDIRKQQARVAANAGRAGVVVVYLTHHAIQALKFVTISDTHGQHHELTLPQGDVLIHAGDVSMKGDESEIKDFLGWFDKQAFEHKILIAGNHDFFFEQHSDEEIDKILPNGITYLKDNGTTIKGFRIWGSPVTPWFFNWAFNRHRGDPIRRHWDLIPDDTDILITHGPLFRTLDKNKKGEHLGCKDLYLKVHQVKPLVHVFGHIHESYGVIDKSDIKFINACILDYKYEMTNQPISFEL